LIAMPGAGTLGRASGGENVHSEVMIAVRDVPKSAAWYRQLLACESDHGRSDFDRLVADGRVLLMLHQLDAAEHGLPAPVEGAVGSGVLIWIYVDDLKAVVERARTMKAPIVVEPHANPQTGWREFTLRDPDGYHVAMAEF
jgi:catechol 2,3-dioxygenase-like lactoylglutathione lyase family enzyme